MPVRVPVGSSDYPSVMDLLQLPTFCSCNNLHDRSATFCISVLQKTIIAKYDTESNEDRTVFIHEQGDSGLPALRD